MTGERMRLIGWRPLRKGALRGFATVELPIGLTIIDCPVLSSHGKAWATLPGKPQIGQDGRQRTDPKTGKPAYTPVNEWQSKRLHDAFSARVVELVAAADPHAFDNQPTEGEAA